MLTLREFLFAGVGSLVKWPTHRHGLDSLLSAKVMLHPIFHSPAFGATNMGSRSLLAILAVDLLHNRLVAIIGQQLCLAHSGKIRWWRGTGNGERSQHRDKCKFFHKIAASSGNNSPYNNSPYNNSPQQHGSTRQASTVSPSYRRIRRAWAAGKAAACAPAAFSGNTMTI